VTGSNPVPATKIAEQAPPQNDGASSRPPRPNLAFWPVGVALFAFGFADSAIPDPSAHCNERVYFRPYLLAAGLTTLGYGGAGL
ncbi:hypothetical protein, partial [Rhodoblastus acidophilus]|uniref:hypothetical protein n=1 Tax=Rhodoblastus acidophilus TaxID=1074 RepID=UPI0022247EBD